MSRDGSGVVPGALRFEPVGGSKSAADDFTAGRLGRSGAGSASRTKVSRDGSGVVPGALVLEPVGGSKPPVDVAALRRPGLMVAAVDSEPGSFEDNVLAEGLPQKREPKTWADRVGRSSSRFAEDDEVMPGAAVESDSGVGAPKSWADFANRGRRSRFAPEDGTKVGGWW
jgi:hypothetical protein